MRPIAPLTVALFAVCALPAFAADRAEIEARYSPQFQPCMDADPSTMGMNQCIGAEYERQDARLNAKYREVMAELNARQQEKLRNAQRAWITYRTTWCRAQQDEDWGTLSTITANYCDLDMTIERTIDLENYREQ